MEGTVSLGRPPKRLGAWHIAHFCLSPVRRTLASHLWQRIVEWGPDSMEPTPSIAVRCDDHSGGESTAGHDSGAGEKTGWISISPGLTSLCRNQWNPRPCSHALEPGKLSDFGGWRGIHLLLFLGDLADGSAGGASATGTHLSCCLSLVFFELFNLARRDGGEACDFSTAYPGPGRCPGRGHRGYRLCGTPEGQKKNSLSSGGSHLYDGGCPSCQPLL